MKYKRLYTDGIKLNKEGDKIQADFEKCVKRFIKKYKGKKINTVDLFDLCVTELWLQIQEYRLNEATNETN